VPRLKKNISTAKRRLESADKLRLSRQFKFVDPFPLGFGTLPEKLVYNALTQAGIQFYYLNDLDFSMPEIDFFKKYQADFMIPSIKVIIEVQGAYWHSKPGAPESDAYKMAIYEAFGYTVLAWWDYEIESHLGDLMANSGILLAAPRVAAQAGQSTELTPLARTKTDTSKGIRTLNRKRAKPYSQFIGTSRRKVRKAKTAYGTR